MTIRRTAGLAFAGGLAAALMACTAHSDGGDDAEAPQTSATSPTTRSPLPTPATALPSVSSPPPSTGFPLPTPAIPSLDDASGDGRLVLRIAGSGEVGYPLMTATCDDGGFAASSNDAQATVSYRGGSLRIQLAGAASPVVVAADGQRDGNRWKATAADARRGISASAQVNCA